MHRYTNRIGSLQCLMKEQDSLGVKINYTDLFASDASGPIYLDHPISQCNQVIINMTLAVYVNILTHMRLCLGLQVVQDVDLLRGVMGRPSRVRNISVIAHVDHGKTTLTDQLLSASGALAQQHAGDRRATDYRKDEQARGITIKST